MFDSETVDLISGAPALDGLSLAELPQLLTKAYTTIVSARIQLRESADENKYSTDIVKINSEMRRLAFTQEAFVSVLAERENRAAAAFVGGTAHYVSLLTEKIRPASRPSYLGYQAISPEVSATLLFMIAEANADAAEMSKSIIVQTDDTVEAALLTAICNLAKGRLRAVLEMDVPSPDQFLNTDLCSQAVRTLYYLLLQGIRLLATNMLGENIDENNFIEKEPKALFDHVKSLCIEPLDMGLNNKENVQYSLYPGPLHLASLLSSVAQDLSSSALVNIPPPDGIDGEPWLSIMQEIAEYRPYLWRNHRKAISDGYLNPGTSSVISFPTGAGKSTLAELKIAATLLRGLKIVFLAPTLALVDQTTKALAKTFPKAKVRKDQLNDNLFDFKDDELPNISVMTPEHCLAMLCFNREIFTDLGLIIFDECHLLHPRDIDRSQRAIDSMLCVLNLTSIAQEADILFLSAMMKNTEEIAGWVQSLTNRPCLPLVLSWKPTRQVRGCVVYNSDRIRVLNSRLREVRTQVSNINIPARLQSELTVRPFGFFCLHQTWKTQELDDYALLPLLQDPVVLATGTTRDRNWYLTPNGNQVASAIAEATAKQSIKTLVFTQTIPLANSATKNLNSSLVSQCVLIEEEKRLYDIAMDETGGSDHLYIEVNVNGKLLSSCVCHHGLLLPVERHLHESLYKRTDGINVMVATSTLAQGMNLPSEVVIIAGDSRFDPGTNQMEQLEAFELLNAAGRAGRAGEGSYGFVLVVPSKVIDFDDKANRIHRHWAELKAIFTQSDQCLKIDDPIESLLDHIHIAATNLSPMASYLVRRLPIGESSKEDDTDAPVRELLGRSFAAYRARQKGDQEWVGTRIASAIAARNNDPETLSVMTWADHLAASAGVPVSIIRDLGKEFAEQPLDNDALMLDWRNWLLDWLNKRPKLITLLLRNENLEGLFGREYKELYGDEARGKYALPHLARLLNCWMTGDSLADLELSYGTRMERIGKCENAREFVLRLVPDLAYIFGLPAQVFQSMYKDNIEVVDLPIGLETLGSCVREGFDQTEKLALWQHRKRIIARRAVHREFKSIEPYLEPAIPGEKFSDVIARIKSAINIAS